MVVKTKPARRKSCKLGVALKLCIWLVSCVAFIVYIHKNSTYPKRLVLQGDRHVFRLLLGKWEACWITQQGEIWHSDFSCYYVKIGSLSTRKGCESLNEVSD